MTRRVWALAVTAALALAWSCGGGGGSSGGSSTSELTVQASFAPSTREVPGYADTLLVKVVPPAGVQLPGTFPNPFVLTRNSTSRLLSGLVRSAAPYRFEMEALTEGEVVGTTVRTIVVNSGSPPPIDVSANMQSEIDSVAIEGLSGTILGQNLQLTAHARDDQGSTLFSGTGFSWLSSDPTVVYVDPESGLCIPREVGSSTIKATLTGTAKNATVTVEVTSNGQVTVDVSPNNAMIEPGSMQQFSALVGGTASQSVTWSVIEQNGGEVSSTGQYIAPVSSGTFHVRATSEVDPTAFDTAVVVVTDGAQWTFVDLHMPQLGDSMATRTDGVQQVGRSFAPILWNGTAESYVGLRLPGLGSLGGATGVSGGRQVGYDDGRAYMWSGTAESRVTLHPDGAFSSVAYDIDGDYQVGYVLYAKPHAVIWNNTAESMIDLDPGTPGASVANAISGSTQGGYTFDVVANRRSAAMWNMSAASYVNLDPGQAGSEVRDVHGTTQVGEVKMSSGETHAARWSGSAASWLDLHPSGFSNSWAYGTYSGLHVGTVEADGVRHAFLWSNSGSKFDIHSVTPPEFKSSEAFGIWQVGATTYIVGYARLESDNRNHAAMWIRTAS